MPTSDHRLPDEDLTVLVERASEDYFTARYSSKLGKTWAELDGASKNVIREAALPHLFHGTKALHDLGYRKLRIVATAEDLDALPFGTVVRSDAGTIATKCGFTLGVVFGDERPFPWRYLDLPVTVMQEAP